LQLEICYTPAFSEESMRPISIVLLLVAGISGCQGEEKEPTPVPVVDEDGDGFSPGDDCDDGDPGIHPGALEVCDGIDNDCNDAIDDNALDSQPFYTDADADGFGVADATIEACEAPEGTVEIAGDCDDGNARVFPDAREECDGIDNDCDDAIDEDAGLTFTYYADTDEDGFGSADSPVEDCAAPEGFVDNALDCDDTDPSTNPDAAEVCDGIDNNCSGVTDGDAID